MAREKPFDPTAAGPFGIWFWNILEDYNRASGRRRLTLEAFAKEAELEYSHFHGVVKGRRGRPIKPGAETVAKIIEAMDALKIPVDAEEGMKRADLVPEGYRLVRAADFREECDLAPDEKELLESYRTTPGVLKPAAKAALKGISVGAV